MSEPGTSRVLKAGKDFFAQISKNEVPSGTIKKSEFGRLFYLLPQFLLINSVLLLDALGLKNQILLCTAFFLFSLGSLLVLLGLLAPDLGKQQYRRAAICIIAAILIIMVYVTLVAVNRSYISLVIVPIIMLVFIGALWRKDSHEVSLKPEDNDSSEAEKASSNCGSANNDKVMVAIALLPYCALWIIGNMVVSQFFLFLSSTMGVLTLMVAWLPSPEVAPALEVLRRASLVVVLLTAHIMAGELLGENVVLVCTPELVAALLWFSSHLGHGGTTVITIDKATSPESGGLCLSAVITILSYIARSIDESDEGENLLVRYSVAVVVCAVSGILLSLCGFALRQWPGEMKASTSSEKDGAVRLFNFWRNVMFIAAALLLIVSPLVNAQLGLQLRGEIADIVEKCPYL